MTTYRNIHGRSIQAVTTDPTGDITEGQIWYNTTSDTFKTVLLTEAFSAGGSAVTARWGAMSFGSQTAGVMAAGNTATARTGVTEEYNGSGFSTGGTAGTARYRGGGAGTETAGLIFGGESPGGDTGDTEEYNGSSWSEQNNLSKARRTTGFGVQTAAYAVGGYDNANKQSQVESYDGTSWTSGTALPLAGLTEGGSGTTSSGRTCGGFFGPGATHPPSSPQTTNNNIGWNGSSWSDDTALPSNRYNTSGFGTSGDDYYAAGGRATPPNASIDTVNYWNGTSWTVSPSLATARYNGQGQNGTPTAFVYMSGNASGTVTGNTEEFNKSANVITGASWASGDTLNTSRYGLRGTGTQTSMVVAGGNVPPNSNTNVTEEYDGSSWTNSTNLPAVIQDGNMTGTESASIYSGGSINPGSNPGATNHYNGSSWTAGGNTATDVNQYALTGTSTAAVAFGGYITTGPGRTNAIQNYDGSSWTSNPVSLPANRGLMRSAGTQTACILVGGNNPPGSPTQPIDSLEWDGSSISTGPNNVVGMNDHGGWGTSTEAYFMGGDQPTGTGGTGPSSVNNFYYNGTVFVTSVSMTTGRGTFGWSKSSNAAGLTCGGGPGHNNDTQEFTPESSALNVKTLTQS